MGACARRGQPAVLVLGLLVLGGAYAAVAAPAAAPRFAVAPLRSAQPPTTAVDVPPTELFRQGLVVPMGSGSDPDSLQLGKPTVLHEGGVYKMWFFGCTPSYYCTIDYATSSNGHSWVKHGVVLAPSGILEQLIGYPSVVKAGSTYWLFYNGYNYSTYRIFAATSPDGINWTRQGLVLDVGPSGSLDAQNVLYPNVLYNGTGFTMWYTGTDNPTPPNAWILRANSTDGLNWTKDGLAVDRGSPGSDDGFQVHSAYVQRLGSLYEMVYEGQPNTSVDYIMYAQSTDGITWEKLGIALTALPRVESLVGQPAFLIEANQSWSVWYGVRNDVSDGSIYLAVSDAEPPVTTATLSGTQGKAGWYVSNVTVTLSAHDNLSGVGWTNYSVDAGPEVTYTGGFVIADGAHIVTFRSTDRAGNAEVNRTVSARVDTVAPVSSAALQGIAGDHGWYTSAVTATLAATDAGSGVASLWYSVDGGPWQNYSTPLRFLDGIHVLAHRAADVAGNMEMASLLAIKVDTTAPAVALLAPAHTTQSSVTVYWGGSDTTSGVSEYELSVDGGGFVPFGMNTTATLTLADGAHTIRVRAIDGAGNTGTAVANLTVDTNLLSFNGPYSGIPTVLIIALAAVLVAFLLWRRRKKQPEATPPTPQPPPQG